MSSSRFKQFTLENEERLKELDGISSNYSQSHIRIFQIAVCKMNLQDYPAAISDFEKLIFDFRNVLGDDDSYIIKSRANIEFCIKPIPLSPNQPTNKRGDYMHYFLLQRFGGLRYLK